MALKLEKNHEGTLTTKVFDAEGDPIDCKFNYDDCVEIDTEGYSYITLTRHQLIELAKAVQKADKQYKKEHEYELQSKQS